jgi:hypothetical protein
VGKGVETAKGKQEEVRQSLLADLRRPDGAQRFARRHKAEVQLAVHLKDADLSGWI